MPVDHGRSVCVVRVGQRAAHERVQEARAQVKAAHAAVRAVGDQQRVCVRLTDRLRKVETRVGGIAVDERGVGGAGENLRGAFRRWVGREPQSRVSTRTHTRTKTKRQSLDEIL